MWFWRFFYSFNDDKNCYSFSKLWLNNKFKLANKKKKNLKQKRNKTNFENKNVTTVSLILLSSKESNIALSLICKMLIDVFLNWKY